MTSAAHDPQTRPAAGHPPQDLHESRHESRHEGLHESLPHGAVRLADWGVIRASGADARSFLHGQLTQDTQHLSHDQARLAGYCSVKGRLLASFVVWRQGPDDLLLACSADLLPAVLKRLSMFVLRAACKLSDASADIALWGVCGGVPAPPWSRAATADGGDVIQLPDAVIDGVVVHRALHARPALAPAPDLPALPADTWRALEVFSGVARVMAATSDRFVPQMVNLELVGGVSFQKGCYPGQEIVARSQYRGTLKRRAYVLKGADPLHAGQEVFSSADPGQPAGQVVLAGTWRGMQVALTELKIAALTGGTLHAGSAAGPLLTPATLPYTLPLEAA